MKILLLLISLSLFGLAGCKPDQSNVPILKLTPADIQSWTEVPPDTVNVVLTEQAASVLKMVTEQNLNARIQIYMGDALMYAPVVHEPISNGQLSFSGTDSHDTVVHLLPPDKKTAQ